MLCLDINMNVVSVFRSEEERGLVGDSQAGWHVNKTSIGGLLICALQPMSFRHVEKHELKPFRSRWQHLLKIDSPSLVTDRDVVSFVSAWTILGDVNLFLTILLFSWRKTGRV